MVRVTQQRHSHHPARGFTLVELLVVTSVMLILIAILLPSFKRAREDARRTVCLANLKHVGVGLFAYAADNNDRGPQIADPIGRKSPRQLLSTLTEVVNLGRLWPLSVSDPNLFYCPSQTEFRYSTDTSLLAQEVVAGSYAYAIHVPTRRSPVFSVVRHLAMVSDDFVTVDYKVGTGRYSHRRGYNVLYTDGSVSWYLDADESIWKRNIHWDDETDDLTYDSLYAGMGMGAAPSSGQPYGDYPEGSQADVFRVWRAFCYSEPDPF